MKLLRSIVKKREQTSPHPAYIGGFLDLSLLYRRRKLPDDTEPDAYLCSCRHAKLRERIKNQTFALMEFRKRYPQYGKKIRGIDAASQEIGCRPEVFAQVYRTLQDNLSFGFQPPHTFKNDKLNGIFSASEPKDGGLYDKLPQFGLTYHVGEDFLDLVDGLRAIDEAILYLNMGCGSRLGHALALGVSPQEWYKKKGYHIAVSKQDYLDNLVWLYYAIIRYQICGFDNLKNSLEKLFSKYFEEVYGKYILRNEVNAIQNRRVSHGNRRRDTQFDIHAYYEAWKLRGDAPELYKKGFFDGRRSMISSYEYHAVNYGFPDDINLRLKNEPAMLYYYYHYNTKVRLEGRRVIDVKVTMEHVKAVTEVQKAMQREIVQRGIGIETNPSSNCMIGTFERYDEHPIFTFFNNGLTFDREKLEASPQLWVSINTDDQGVFNIKLENEYALLARALEKMKDKDGRQIYSKTMIYNWLENIRKMGLDQSFLSRPDT